MLAVCDPAAMPVTTKLAQGNALWELASLIPPQTSRAVLGAVDPIPTFPFPSKVMTVATVDSDVEAAVSLIKIQAGMRTDVGLRVRSQ